MTIAESRRLKNPQAMDIIGALKNEYPPELSPNHSNVTGNDWLNLALSMEERQYVFSRFIYTRSPILTLTRIDVRDRVKRLQKVPREESRLEVERMRQALTTDFMRLQSLQPDLNLTGTHDFVDPHAESFDNLDEEVGIPEPFGPDQSQDASNPNTIPPECRPLHLPSSHNTATNHPLHQVELTLRIRQATQYLSSLRDAIAQKSFQYSHVMRAAPSKGARTRSRSAILQISERIAQYSRVYCRARAAMVRLRADERTLNKFKQLLRADVKASTAILDPNIPGSSSLRLSWIWETGAGISGSSPDAMRECKPRYASRYNFQLIFLKSNVFIGFRPEHKNTDGKRNYCL